MKNGVDLNKSFIARWVCAYDIYGDPVETYDQLRCADISVDSWKDLAALAEELDIGADEIASIEFCTYYTGDEGEATNGTSRDYVIDWVEGEPRLMEVIG